jgi:hypothetical protein
LNPDDGEKTLEKLKFADGDLIILQSKQINEKKQPVSPENLDIM